MNVVQTKLSVQSNRGSARWQAPELHYNEEGLSHVTTKSDVYAYGMTCFEVSIQLVYPISASLTGVPYYQIFTGTIPFAHLSSDGMVIMEILQKKSKPRRPTGSIFQKRGLTDRLWGLLEDCWTFDAQDRLSMIEVAAIVQNESRFIVKERERLESMITTENTFDNISGEQRLSEAEDQATSDDGEEPVPHSPIKVSLELRLDESLQQERTVHQPRSSSISSTQAITENDNAEILGQFLPRGRFHPTVPKGNDDFKSKCVFIIPCF